MARQLTLDNIHSATSTARNTALNAYRAIPWAQWVHMPESSRQEIIGRVLAAPRAIPEIDPDRAYRDEVAGQEQMREIDSYTRDLYNSGDLRTEQIIDYGVER